MIFQLYILRTVFLWLLGHFTPEAKQIACYWFSGLFGLTSYQLLSANPDPPPTRASPSNTSHHSFDTLFTHFSHCTKHYACGTLRWPCQDQSDGGHPVLNQIWSLPGWEIWSLFDSGFCVRTVPSGRLFVVPVTGQCEDLRFFGWLWFNSAKMTDCVVGCDLTVQCLVVVSGLCDLTVPGGWFWEVHVSASDSTVPFSLTQSLVGQAKLYTWKLVVTAYN